MKCGSRSRLVEPERILPDHIVDAKSALRPEALKPTFTGFRVVARLGSPPRASCATANRASRPRRRLKPPVDLAEALRRAALSSSGRTAASAACRIFAPISQSCRCWRRYECLKWVRGRPLAAGRLMTAYLNLMRPADNRGPLGPDPSRLARPRWRKRRRVSAGRA